jgi:6-phosphogluconolactonase
MLHIFDDTNSLLNSLADFIIAKANDAINRTGRFSFVLSGGSSPKKLYELLASPAYQNKIDWTKFFFFFGDERYVPALDPQSNFLMAKTVLFDPLKISKHQIFQVDTTLSPEESAAQYEKVIRTYFNNEPAQFDFILLGLGDNSHTASLFPHSTILTEKTALVKGTFIEEVNMYRITLTAPVINQGDNIVFLVYGSGKAEAVKHILEDATDIQQYPAQLIKAERGELHWFMDDAAANNLKSKS